MARDFAGNFSRRAFCGGCAALAAGCAPKAADGTGIGGTGDTGDTADGTDTTTPAEYPCGQTVPTGAGRLGLSLADYPDLADVGGWYAVSSGAGEIIVAHAMDGCYAAIRRACAHQGVAIDYVPSRGQFVCPAHGAIYDWQGNKVAGPQPNGLPVYPAARDGDTIWVEVS